MSAVPWHAVVPDEACRRLAPCSQVMIMMHALLADNDFGPQLLCE